MMLGKNNYLELLSTEDVQAIHETTLSTLENTGVKVLHEEALEIFAQAGAHVDFKAQIARLPISLVEKHIMNAPESFKIYARDEKKNLVFADGITNYVSMQTTPFVFDLYTGERRSATVEDTCYMSKIADALTYHADGYCMVHPEDVPEQIAHVYMMKAQIENSSKVFRGRVNGKRIAQDCIKIASMLAGGDDELKKKPNTYSLISCTSPLVMDTAQIEGLLEYTRLGLPLIVAAAGMSGATTPITLAGTLVETNAEVLSHIAFAQIVNPGTPVIYGTATSVMDMKTTNLRYGAVEQGMLAAAAAQLARFYHIPSRVVGGTTDSKILDMQAGMESTRNLMIASMAGSNYISCAFGGMDLGMTTSYEKVFHDHENIANIQHLLEGIKVDEESLSERVIADVGPGGEYLTHDQTMTKYKEAHFIPEFAETRSFANWVESKDTLSNKITKTIEDIIRSPNLFPIDDSLKKEIDSFIKFVEAR